MIYNVDNLIFNTIRPHFLSLLNTLNTAFDNVSILVENTKGRNYRYSKSGIILKDNPFSNAGAVIRYSPKNQSTLLEYSFNDFSPLFLESIPSILAKNVTADANSAELRFATISDSVSAVLEKRSNSTPDILNESTHYEIDPDVLSPEYIINTMKELHQSALNYDTRIIDCVCIFQYLTIHKMFLSSDKDYQQHLMWTNGVLQPMAQQDTKTQYYLQTFSTLGGAELLEQMKSGLAYPCKCAIELLDSTPPPSGEYDVICMPDVTGLIAHEAFGHGVEMDMFVKDRALAKEYLNQQIASPLVTMHDNAKSCKESATFFFDDEGALSNDTIIIKDGILKNGINDALSAKLLDIPPTGNGRRESFERKVYARMTNTYFEPGTSNLEDMIASIDYGILLENSSNGMEDPKNWGIQCMVNMGREIKNGSLTGRIFSPICLSGSVPDLLKSISMVSSNFELSGCGYCGKGYKEWVKVSDGGPAIKCRVRIS